MLLSSRDLSAYTPTLTAMTLAEIRAGLRAVRWDRKRKAGLTLDRLQANSGVDRAVIHRVESVEKYPEYNLELRTLTRLVEGMDLTLSEFFRQLEIAQELPKSRLHQGTPLDITDAIPHEASHVPDRSVRPAALDPKDLDGIRESLRVTEATARRRLSPTTRGATATARKASKRRTIHRQRRKKAS